MSALRVPGPDGRSRLIDPWTHLEFTAPVEPEPVIIAPIPAGVFIKSRKPRAQRSYCPELSDADILGAMIVHKTQAAAATALGVSQSSINRRLQAIRESGASTDA